MGQHANQECAKLRVCGSILVVLKEARPDTRTQIFKAVRKRSDFQSGGSTCKSKPVTDHVFEKFDSPLGFDVRK